MSTATKTIRQTKILKDSADKAAKAGKNSTDKVPAKTAAVKAEKPKIRTSAVSGRAVGMRRG